MIHRSIVPTYVLGCAIAGTHLRRSATRAPSFCVSRRGKACRLSPHPFARLRRPSFAALRIVSLDEAEHFLQNRNASVAMLRWCSGSSRNAVRLPSGIDVHLHRNTHLANRSRATLRNVLSPDEPNPSFVTGNGFMSVPGLYLSVSLSL